METTEGRTCPNLGFGRGLVVDNNRGQLGRSNEPNGAYVVVQVRDGGRLGKSKKDRGCE